MKWLKHTQTVNTVKALFCFSSYLLSGKFSIRKSTHKLSPTAPPSEPRRHSGRNPALSVHVCPRPGTRLALPQGLPSSRGRRYVPDVLGLTPHHTLPSRGFKPAPHRWETRGLGDKVRGPGQASACAPFLFRSCCFLPCPQDVPFPVLTF